MVKRMYVHGMRVIRRAPGASRVLNKLAQSDHRSLRWLRSLFSIYDSPDMVTLDVPWWTYTSIDSVEPFLAARDGQARVFEYGSGASTVWLAKRAAQVISVEHDEAFWQSMQFVFAEHTNVDVLLVPPIPARGAAGEVRSERAGYEHCDFSAYVSAIERSEGMFDLVIVDGRARNACLAAAVPRLAPGGMIVFDNSNRRRYRQAINSSGLDVAVCRGFAPALPYPSETTLLKDLA